MSYVCGKKWQKVRFRLCIKHREIKLDNERIPKKNPQIRFLFF